MHLSKRLNVIANMVTDGHTVADIGTDHGYVPISLLLKNTVPRALAMDISKGSLEKAVQNGIRYGVADRLECRLSDGFSAFSPGDADAVVLAGMGGTLMQKILENAGTKLDSVKELILSPHGNSSCIRKFLPDRGFCIVQEDMVFDKGKYYFCMKAVRSTENDGRSPQDGPPDCRQELFYRYGRQLLEDGHPVLKEYLQKEARKYQNILAAVHGTADLSEAEKELHVLRQALKFMENRKNDENSGNV